MKIIELIKKGKSILEENNIDNAEYDAKYLMMYTLKCERAKLFMIFMDEAGSEVEKNYLSYIDKRKTHYPLQYICNEQEFMGFEFYVDENVLIPRQDTEILVEEALNKAASHEKTLKVLDMCTGSGCIGISYYLKRKEKGFADEVTLADLSEGAIRVATKNATLLQANVNIVKTDLFDKLVGKKYNIIISNPPYIESEVIPTLMDEVKCYEPMMALDGTSDGLYFYRKIIEKARTFLYENGELLFEIGYNQYDGVSKILIANQFTDIKLVKDYAGLDRVVYARLK